jgi:hypothetical protein
MECPCPHHGSRPCCRGLACIDSGKDSLDPEEYKYVRVPPDEGINDSVNTVTHLDQRRSLYKHHTFTLTNKKHLFLFSPTIQIITMPSKTQSWFARHMTPPPPLNTMPTCPCANCYNVLAQRPQTQSGTASHSHASGSGHSSTESLSQARQDSDNMSVSSRDSTTTTTHIERILQD